MRSHLFPSRTQKLSSTAPMVLHWRRCGRVGHRRNSHIGLDLVIEAFLLCVCAVRLLRSFRLILPPAFTRFCCAKPKCFYMRSGSSGHGASVQNFRREFHKTQRVHRPGGVQFPQRANLSKRLIMLRALRCGSPAKCL